MIGPGSGSALSFLCRDCLGETQGLVRRCAHCGSPRGLAHPERDRLGIAHVDCDAFFAAIEKRDDPSLRDKPLIIGGGRRGVVSTACYIARIRGVRSAMPMFKALAACPDAVVLRPDMAKYASVAREVRELMRQLTPLVEPLSIDEAFLDLSGTERLHGLSPAASLARFARTVEASVGISVSIGLSYGKFLAKVASDLDKPRGFSLIGRAEARAFLRDKPVRLVPGVGGASETRWMRAGFRTLGDVQDADPAALRRLKDGERLLALAHGIDPRAVQPSREAKSVSAETTFEADTGDAQALTRVLYRMSEKVARRLRANGLAATAVTLKLKTARFQTITRSQSNLPPTQLTNRLFAATRGLLATAGEQGPYRLLGISAGGLVSGDEADCGDLVDRGVAREKARESAVEHLRGRYGDSAVIKGWLFPSKPCR